MDNINSISGTITATRMRELASTIPPRKNRQTPTLAGDRVEISDVAALLSRLAELPEDRARKIVSIRKSIQDGNYNTNAKLDLAMEGLLKDLQGGSVKVGII